MVRSLALEEVRSLALEEVVSWDHEWVSWQYLTQGLLVGMLQILALYAPE